MRLGWILGLLVTLACARGAAQEIPCVKGPCMRPHRPGTHFIAEINGGGSFAGGIGPAVGGVVGIGGKLDAFPLRFYLVGELAYASATRDGTLSTAATGFHEERDYRDLALGLRVYIPVHGPLSLFVDAMGGGSHVAAFLERDGLSTLSESGWQGLGLLAAGAQVRLFHHLAIGLRARAVLATGGASPTPGMEQPASLVRGSLTVGLTWHF